MSDTDFRLAYDALMTRMPDPPSYEKIRARMVQVKRPRAGAAWRAAPVSALLVLMVTVGVAWLIRGGDGGQGVDGSVPDLPAPTPWGPLAVVAGDGSGDLALIEGILKVSDECVLLHERGEDVLLVWPADRTSWDPDTKTINYESTDGAATTLRDGDLVTFGGGGSSVNEDGIGDEEFIASVDWVAEPAPSCVVDTRWFVGDLVRSPSSP